MISPSCIAGHEGNTGPIYMRVERSLWESLGAVVDVDCPLAPGQANQGLGSGNVVKGVVR